LAGIFILADLGRIDRFYYLVIYPQLHSPLFWDFIALHALLGISMILCFVILREIFIERGLPDKCSNIEKFLYGVVTVGREINIFKLLTIKIVNISLFLLIVLSYFVTTELFMSLKAHPAWNTPLLIPIFFTSSALCGLSVAVILRSFYGDVRDSRDRKLFSSLINKLILFFIIADLALLLIKYITYSSNSLIAQSYSTSPLYFFFLLIIGNIFPILVILLAKHKEVLLYGLLPTLILIGVFLKRADLIIGSYFRRWLPFPDKAFYVPTVWEILVVMGVYSGGIFALVMFFYVLNYLKNKEESAI